nr:hypothetical protein [uncultured Psychroserpens sp.]
MNPNKNSNKSFQFAIITIVSVLIFVLFQFLAANNNISEDIYTYASSFMLSIIFVAVIAGFIYSIKGLREPISVKKIIGLCVASIFTLILIGVVIANVTDIYDF